MCRKVLCLMSPRISTHACFRRTLPVPYPRVSFSRKQEALVSGRSSIGIVRTGKGFEHFSRDGKAPTVPSHTFSVVSYHVVHSGKSSAILFRTRCHFCILSLRQVSKARDVQTTVQHQQSCTRQTSQTILGLRVQRNYLVASSFLEKPIRYREGWAQSSERATASSNFPRSEEASTARAHSWKKAPMLLFNPTLMLNGICRSRRLV